MRDLDNDTEQLVHSIIGAIIEVHRELGSGYLEKVYEQALAYELDRRRLAFQIQAPVLVYYKDNPLKGQILDVLVENRVVLELKTVDKLTTIHEQQLLSYLKSTRLPVGLLVNFREALVKNGLKRFINTLYRQNLA